MAPAEGYDPSTEYMSYKTEHLCVGPGNSGCPGKAVGGVYRVGEDVVRLCRICADARCPDAKTDPDRNVLAMAKADGWLAGDPSFLVDMKRDRLVIVGRHTFHTNNFSAGRTKLVQDELFVKLTTATNRGARGSQFFTTDRAYGRTVGLLEKHCSSWWPTFRSKVEEVMVIKNLWIGTYSETNDEDEDVGDGEEVNGGEEADDEEGGDEDGKESGGAAAATAATGKVIGCGRQPGNPGSFKWHHDKGFVGHMRVILTLGDSPSGDGKTMSVQDRSTGKWCRFKVPHGTHVSLSLVGGGVEGGQYIHRIDGAGGTYTIIMEGTPVEE